MSDAQQTTGKSFGSMDSIAGAGEQGGGSGLRRRDFLMRTLAIGGSGLMLATMKAWGWISPRCARHPRDCRAAGAASAWSFSAPALLA